jgi:intraflagellar transport protein 46
MPTQAQNKPISSG